MLKMQNIIKIIKSKENFKSTSLSGFEGCHDESVSASTASLQNSQNRIPAMAKCLV